MADEDDLFGSTEEQKKFELLASKISLKIPRVTKYKNVASPNIVKVIGRIIT